MYKLKIIILIVLACGLWSGGQLWAAPAGLAMGLGMESRLQREVNPDFVDDQNVGQFFLKFHSWPWVVSAEFSQDSNSTSTGSLRIQTQTTSYGFWGRYEFLPEDQWSPFLGVGLGAYVDRVDTSLQNSTLSLTGSRGRVGLSGGVRKEFWRRLLLELEGRLDFVEQNQEPNFSGLLRLGVEIY